MKHMAREIYGWVRRGYSDWLRQVVLGTGYEDLRNTQLAKAIDEKGFNLTDGLLAVKQNSEGVLYVASGFHEFTGIVPGKLYVVARGHAPVQDLPESVMKSVFSHPEAKARGLRAREASIGLGTTVAGYGEPLAGLATAASCLGLLEVAKIRARIIQREKGVKYDVEAIHDVLMEGLD